MNYRKHCLCWKINIFKMKNIFVVLFLFCCLHSKAVSDSIPSNSKPYFKSYCISYIADTRDALTCPARWEGKDWMKFFGITAGGIFLMSQDLRIHDVFQKNRTSIGDN